MIPVVAEMKFPLVDPVAFRVFGFEVRWYGVSYVVAFFLAYLVLRGLARRGRWPVAPERVVDVLFWGILGVMLGGRIGWMLFYASDRSFPAWFNIREGGMSFHGGLLGVVLAYWVYALREKVRFRDLGDGLALAVGPGIAVVRIANFLNAELVGRRWDGPWAVRFPRYEIGKVWDGTFDADLRHPSQLYQSLGEGLLTFLILRWLMLGRGWGGGRVSAAFLVCYGGFRFATEFFREPDAGIGYQWLHFTRGQWLCLAMVAVGVLVAFLLRRARPGAPVAPAP
ncbi:MAG: prolipoprotein diacylglyceryl transferase [Planctomycetes bacterium]|nr:prolipoprotein diacylglyceryl transferase [Planctomycetota bacterium]